MFNLTASADCFARVKTMSLISELMGDLRVIATRWHYETANEHAALRSREGGGSW